MAEDPNVMKKIYVDKVVLNMGIGKSGDVIETAKLALAHITNKRPCARNAKKTHRDFGVRKGEPIGVAVTSRGDDARTLFTRLIEAKDNTIKHRSFDDYGNFSFGIKEHIDIPGVKYDPKIGILGLDVCVTLARPGFGIRTRSKHKASVGKSHTITANEARSYITESFGARIEQ